MADSWASLTQTDFETEGEAVATRTLESTGACRRFPITTVLISILAAGLALTLPRAVSFAQGDEGGSKTVFAGGVAFLANSSSQANTGCQEWKANQVGAGKVGATSMRDCANKCRATPGCGFANFKEGFCDDGADDGTCYFFSWCTPEPSDCWHLQQVVSPTPSPSVQTNRGCQEWEANQVGAGRVGATNMQDCANKCRATPGCGFANFKEGDCADGADAGTCFFFSWCTPKPGDCWHLQQVLSPTPSPRLQAKTGCREWLPAQVGGGNVGATNIQDCSNKCKATSGCKFANYNPSCPDSSQEPCYLFNECTPEPQDCWILMDVVSETATPAPSAIPPQLDNVMSFVKGDRFDTLNFNRCAMVGSSSVMKNSNAGGKIDNEYDTVIRLNRPPRPDGDVARDLGVRMDVLFLNHDLSLQEAVEVMQPSGSFEKKSCSQLEHCRNAAILHTLSAGRDGRDMGCLLDEMTEVWGLDRPLVGCVRKGYSDRFYELKPLNGFQPSTGFQAFMMFVPLCNVLDLYGFGWHGKFDTVDGHYNWDGHNLEQEHLLMDFFARRDYAGLPSTWDAGMIEWLERHAAQVTKVVGTAP